MSTTDVSRSRDSLPALAFVLVEGSLRALAGPAGLLGNHVILAHDERHSVRVKSGENVRAGQTLAACGNFGNSTEPHLHFQVQDRESPLIAAGLPVAFADLRDDQGDAVDVPPAGKPVTFSP